jgi:hypothetical protein
MNRYDTTSRLELAESQLEQLKKRMAVLETTHARCDERIRELHEQNSDLVQLTVASQLLAAAVQREGVLCTMEEIVINMIGSEELAIFDIDSDGQSLRVARIRGIDPASPRLARALGPLRYVQKSGRTLIARNRVHAGDGDGGLTAGIPLKVEGNVTGAIAIFRLLDQKSGLAPVDHELFEILSRQAAMALHSTAFQSVCPTVRPPRPSA